MLPSSGQVFHNLDFFKTQMLSNGWIEKKSSTVHFRNGIFSIKFYDRERRNISVIFFRKQKGHGILVIKVRVIPYRLTLQDSISLDRNCFEIISKVPDNISKVRYWDLAATEVIGSDDPDYTAGCLMGKGSFFYIIDIQRFRNRPEEVADKVKETAERDGHQIPIFMEQEPGSGGVNTIDFYKRIILPEYNFGADKSSISKENRAGALLRAAKNKQIKLLNGFWIGDFLSEIEIFPHGFHDDQVDAVSGAFNQLNV